MVKNFSDMHRAMANREDFSHRSYRGITTDQGYELHHWRTLIAIVDEDGIPVYGDMTYYSQTTSRFQGEILRHALSGKGRDVVKELFADDKDQLRRLTKMMW